MPIPTGYTYKEGSRDTGLVIQDGRGNEFVWVPVNQNQKLTLDVTSTEDIDNNQNTESVNKYGGYYIARYEAGDGTTSSARTSSTADTNTLVSQKGAYVYNYVDVETSKTLATGLSNGSTSVTTQLITAAGWDRALNWIIETGNKTENEVIIDNRSLEKL